MTKPAVTVQPHTTTTSTTLHNLDTIHLPETRISTRVNPHCQLSRRTTRTKPFYVNSIRPNLFNVNLVGDNFIYVMSVGNNLVCVMSIGGNLVCVMSIKDNLFNVNLVGDNFIYIMSIGNNLVCVMSTRATCLSGKSLCDLLHVNMVGANLIEVRCGSAKSVSTREA